MTGRLFFLVIFHSTTDADLLAKITGYNRDFVRSRLKRSREQGILVGRRTLHVEWFDDDPKIACLSFLMDTMTAEGIIVRSGVHEDGRPRYSPK